MTAGGPVDCRFLAEQLRRKLADPTPDPRQTEVEAVNFLHEASPDNAHLYVARRMSYALGRLEGETVPAGAQADGRVALAAYDTLQHLDAAVTS